MLLPATPLTWNRTLFVNMCNIIADKPYYNLLFTNINCYNPICKIYIKAVIWYFHIADPYPLLIIKTHFLIRQNIIYLFKQVIETLLL